MASTGAERAIPEPVAIEAAEYAARQRRAAELAESAGFEALVIWTRGGTSAEFYGDIFYLTNHHSPVMPLQDTAHWTGRSYSGLVLPASGEPVLVVDFPELDDKRVFVDEIRPAMHVPQGVADVLRERGLSGECLGLVGKDTMLLSHAHAMECRLGSELNFEPADHILEGLRVIKSPAELGLMRRASAIGAQWMSTMMEAVQPGATEAEVVAAGLGYLARQGGWCYETAIASGDGSRRFFSRLNLPTFDRARVLAPGDLVHIDAWGVVDGYYTDLMRSTVVGGHPSGDQLALLEGAAEIIDHIIEGIRPGVTAGDLYRRGSDWMHESGFGDHRATQAQTGTDFNRLFPVFGHSCGVGLEPPWIVEGELTVIEANMCLAIEAMIGRPGVGAAGCEQDLIVGDDGCEVITAECPTRWWR
jgi:Xaa-Pro aminopeptidase